MHFSAFLSARARSYSCTEYSLKKTFWGHFQQLDKNLENCLEQMVNLKIDNLVYFRYFYILGQFQFNILDLF